MTNGKTKTRVFAVFATAFMIALLGFLMPKAAWAENSPDPFEQATTVELADGEYSVDIALSGGTGKVSLDSPTLLTVRGGHAVATVRWSSPYYDYMKVNDVKYLAQSGGSGEYSEFQIPVLSFGDPFPVVGDTTAMSEPHEIDYEIVLDPGSVTPGAPEGFAKPTGAGSTASASSASSASSAGSSSSSSATSSSSGDNALGFVLIGVIFVVALGAGIAIGVVRGRNSR